MCKYDYIVVGSGLFSSVFAGFNQRFNYVKKNYDEIIRGILNNNKIRCIIIQITNYFV